MFDQTGGWQEKEEQKFFWYFVYLSGAQMEFISKPERVQLHTEI